MNVHATKEAAAASMLMKADPNLPALIVTGTQSIAIRVGTTFDGHAFDVETPVLLPDTLFAGFDYVIAVDRMGVAMAVAIEVPPPDDSCLGGFHFAPGGNAGARAGGDDVPAINPFSLWDVNFRPSCPDPRGMALVEGPDGKFWCDIYLLGVSHLHDGTSRFGKTIADGRDPPENPAGGHFKKLDYDTACAVMKHHGKSLLSTEEFARAAIGGTERTAREEDPEITGLDAPRTSRRGVMQAFGSMWVWGHDGDPDEPRASLFGGSWLDDGSAGSRYANVGNWPDDSNGNLGARGRSDHLNLG